MVFQKEIEEYLEKTGSKTHFYLAENPDIIIDILYDYKLVRHQEQEDIIKIELDEARYKVTIRYYEDEYDEVSTLDIVVKITKVRDHDVFDIDFTRK